jgi:hypothetical protein
MLSVFLVAIPLILSPGDCSERLCSCVKLEPIGEARARYPTIFQGRVLDIRDTTIWRTHGPRLRHEKREWRAVTLQVSHVWQGEMGDTIRVLTATDGRACGYDFEQSDEYVVFADPLEPSPLSGNKILHTSTCSHTTLALNAAPLRAALGPPVRQRRLAN